MNTEYRRSDLHVWRLLVKYANYFIFGAYREKPRLGRHPQKTVEFTHPYLCVLDRDSANSRVTLSEAFLNMRFMVYISRFVLLFLGISLLWGWIVSIEIDDNPELFSDAWIKMSSVLFAFVTTSYINMVVNDYNGIVQLLKRMMSETVSLADTLTSTLVFLDKTNPRFIMIQKLMRFLPYAQLYAMMDNPNTHIEIPDIRVAEDLNELKAIHDAGLTRAFIHCIRRECIGLVYRDGEMGPTIYQHHFQPAGNHNEKYIVKRKFERQDIEPTERCINLIDASLIEIEKLKNGAQVPYLRLFMRAMLVIYFLLLPVYMWSTYKQWLPLIYTITMFINAGLLIFSSFIGTPFDDNHGHQFKKIFFIWAHLASFQSDNMFYRYMNEFKPAEVENLQLSLSIHITHNDPLHPVIGLP